MTPRLFGLACFLATLASPCPDVGAEEWPHWRGVNRDAVTGEVSGWKVDGWTDGKPAWQVRVGEGASSPTVHDGVVYVIGWADELDTVTALDAKTGETIWSRSYPAPRYGRHAVGDQRMYRGATATPELDPESGRLFTLGCDGDLRAWDTRAGGQPLWNLNLYDRFQVPRRPQVTKRKNTLRDYGYTTSPLVWGDRVVVEVGSPEHGNLIAFDQATGEIAWASENRDPGGHSGGLAPVEIDGVPCVAVAT